MGRRRAVSAWLTLVAPPLLAASACFVPGFQGDGRNDGATDEGGAGGSSTGGSSVGGNATGGSSTGGGSTGGSSTGGMGGGDSTGGTVGLEDECSESGAHACDENDSKLTLICTGGFWQSAGGCSTDEACEPTTGLCADIIPECADGEPGDLFCSNDDVMECGPNLVSAELIEPCEGRCVSTSGASCVPATCGDGVPDPGEDCDDGDTDNEDACTQVCQAPFCGDGFQQTTETCDDGDADNDDGCTELCELPDCGDGFVQTGEDCDEGANNDNEGACTEACYLPACGDGFVQAGEDCDEGAANGPPSDYACPLNCSIGIAQLAAGSEYSCALHSSAQVKCWGRAEFGQLGLESTTYRGDGPGEMGANLPAVNLGSGAFAKALVAGYGHTCVLLDDDSLKCWGYNLNGQLGLGNTLPRGDGAGEMGNSLPAIDLGMDRHATGVSAGTQHTCALLDDGSIKCWGDGAEGQLGQGNSNDRGDGAVEMGDNLPAIDLGMDRYATALVSGAFHNCALLDDDSVKCWGNNNAGQLGLGDTADRGAAMGDMGDNLPVVDLGTDRYATALAAGYNHTCALLNDDSVKCWGYNTYGQLGLGTNTPRGDAAGEMGDSLPAVDLGSGRHATALSAGSGHTCAVLDDDSLKCWGYGEYGQLGLGDINPRGSGPGQMGSYLLPVNLGAGSSATLLVAGAIHTCALLDDESLKCWGYNVSGALGLGDPDNRGDEPGEMGGYLPTVNLW